MESLEEPAGSASLFGWLRVLLFGLGGLLSGSVSGWIYEFWQLELENDDLGFYFRFEEGIVYGLFWIAAAWIPGALSVRPHIRRSPVWTLAFLAGVTLSYLASFNGAIYTFLYTADFFDSGDGNPGFVVAGFAGGLVGSAGLVFTWQVLFPAISSWQVRTGLIALGAILGTALVIPELPVGQDRYWIFFAIWQGGMAVGLAVADGHWRSRADSRE